MSWNCIQLRCWRCVRQTADRAQTFLAVSKSSPPSRFSEGYITAAFYSPPHTVEPSLFNACLIPWQIITSHTQQLTFNLFPHHCATDEYKEGLSIHHVLTLLEQLTQSCSLNRKGKHFMMRCAYRGLGSGSSHPPPVRPAPPISNHSFIASSFQVKGAGTFHFWYTGRLLRRVPYPCTESDTRHTAN